MNILFLSRWFPYPVNNGSKLRIYNLLRGLSQYHEVSLLSFTDRLVLNSELHEMRKFCSGIGTIPWKEFDPKTLKARWGILGLKPRSIMDTFSSEMAKAITERLNKQNFDLVIASQLQMAAYCQYFRGISALFEEVEVGLFHDQAFSSDGNLNLRYALTWFKLHIYLSQILDSFQACTVASPQECRLLQRNFPTYKKPIAIIPNCLDLDEYKNIKAEKRRNTLIFAGSFKYRANYEAMLWFVREVFPALLDRVPDAQLIISGEHAGLPLPSSKNIILTGHVDDIKTLIASSSVSIAPLLSGGGTRLKILEAMALGTPVVATSKGAEGLSVRSGEHLFLADTPSEFAESILNLLMDAGTYRILTENASRLVNEKYGLRVMLSSYLQLISTIV